MGADLCLCKEVSFIQLATWDDVYMIDVLVSHLEPSDWAALVLQKVADSIASVILNMRNLFIQISPTWSSCVGKKLNKSNLFSNWTQRPLRNEQLRYAVLNGFCLLEIYKAIESQLPHIQEHNQRDSKRFAE
ncbi:exonuclease mut-7 homolog [Aedes albopictus]|uniref:3'-5' exonuclease domain-containing protein n=1 Tax=Aedes albopictus TaxID=7160 RepID=A0ABM1YN75_AEDAL